MEIFGILVLFAAKKGITSKPYEATFPMYPYGSQPKSMGGEHHIFKDAASILYKGVCEMCIRDRPCSIQWFSTDFSSAAVMSLTTFSPISG